MTRDEMRDWRVQDVAKDIVETHAQATPRDWGSPDHALYKLIVAKLVAERDRIAALRSRPAPDEDEGDKAKHMRDSQPRFSQYQMDAATKPLHAEIERLRSRPAPPDDGSLMVRVDPVYAEQMRGEGLAGPFSRITLDERGGVPTLLLTTEPSPTPDTVAYWRSVAQELATEIHKLRGLAAPMETR